MTLKILFVAAVTASSCIPVQAQDTPDAGAPAKDAGTKKVKKAKSTKGTSSKKKTDDSTVKELDKLNRELEEIKADLEDDQ